jgi:hypothetical protein
MLKIITRNMEIIRKDNKISSVTPSMDTVYIKFADNIEIQIPCKLNPKLNAMLNLVATSTAPNITVDLTDGEHPVKFA